MTDLQKLQARVETLERLFLTAFGTLDVSKVEAELEAIEVLAKAVSEADRGPSLAVRKLL